MEGFVYFISGASPTAPVKIGFARDAEERCRQLQTGSHVRLRVLAKFPAYAHAERRVHELCAASRLHGEWFRRSQLVKDAIASAKSGEMVQINDRTIRAYYDPDQLDLLG